VLVIDPNLLPKSMEIVIDKSLYEVFFTVEEGSAGPSGSNPSPSAMDHDGAADKSSHAKDKPSQEKHAGDPKTDDTAKDPEVDGATGGNYKQQTLTQEMKSFHNVFVHRRAGSKVQQVGTSATSLPKIVTAGGGSLKPGESENQFATLDSHSEAASEADLLEEEAMLEDESSKGDQRQ
jgi:hypothetical protein